MKEVLLAESKTRINVCVFAAGEERNELAQLCLKCPWVLCTHLTWTIATYIPSPLRLICRRH